MAQGLSHPQRYRGYVLTAIGLQKLHDRLKTLEAQTRLRQNPRSIAERIQLSEPDGIHSITVRKILDGHNGVDKRSIQLVFQVLQLPLEDGDYAHAGLCQGPPLLPPSAPVRPADVPRGAGAADWGDRFDESEFYGRGDELTQLKQIILSEQGRLVQILGFTGVGKTALATAVARTVQSEFEVVLWKSLHHTPALQAVLTSILQILMQQTQQTVALPPSVDALIGLLIEQLQTHRCLLVLDHFNSVLERQHDASYYRPGYEAYGDLLQAIAEVPHQSCVLTTSREKPRAVGMTDDRHLRSLHLRGLPVSDCQSLINQYHPLIGTPAEWRSFIQQWDGNPLILKMEASYIQTYFNRQIADYLNYSEPGKRFCSDLRDLLRQQFDRLSPLEQELARQLAPYSEPVSVAHLREQIPASLHHRHWLEGLDSLGRRSLLHWRGNGFVLEPLIRLYISECLIDPRVSSLALNPSDSTGVL